MTSAGLSSSFDRDFGRFPGLHFHALSMDVVHEP